MYVTYSPLLKVASSTVVKQQQFRHGFRTMNGLFQ